MNAPLLQLQNVSKHYGSGRTPIIAVSEATRSDLGRLLSVPAERVDVVHHGVSPVFAPRDPAVVAVATNDVTFTVAGMPGVSPHLQGKRVKVLGITTAKRSPLVPDYATAQEMGVAGVDASIWVGFFVPKGTPAAAINKLYAASADALKRPEVKERLAVVGGAEAVATASAAFNARIASDIERYKKVAQQVGIKPE